MFATRFGELAKNYRTLSTGRLLSSRNVHRIKTSTLGQESNSLYVRTYGAIMVDDVRLMPLAGQGEICRTAGVVQLNRRELFDLVTFYSKMGGSFTKTKDINAIPCRHQRHNKI